MTRILFLITVKRRNHCMYRKHKPTICFFIAVLVMIWFSGSSYAEKNPTRTFTVTIDAGHGGKDPGAVGKKTVEKKLTLAIALKVGRYIESQMDNINVVYTRKTDVFIPLDERALIANRSKSDLFISIHVDGFKSTVPKGTSCFVMGQSKNSDNLELVIRENNVIFLEEGYKEKYEGFDNSPASYIIFNLYQNVNLKQSLLFATLVQDQLRTSARRIDRGVSQERFLVLWKTTMPSVLIETGFISNPQEEEYLMTEEGQDIVATSIYTAFRKFKEDQESNNNSDIQATTTGKPDSAIQVKTENNQIQPPVNSTVSEKKSAPETKADSEKIVTRKEVPAPTSADVEFRVQVLASNRKLAPTAPDFKGKKIFEEIQLDGYYKYMTKPIKTYQEALEMRKELLSLFKGAFIVAFKGGRKIPLSEIIEN